MSGSRDTQEGVYTAETPAQRLHVVLGNPKDVILVVIILGAHNAAEIWQQAR